MSDSHEQRVVRKVEVGELNNLLKPYVKMFTNTQGAASVNFSGVASGFRTFGEAFWPGGSGNANGLSANYTILDGTAWEQGIGTILIGGGPDGLQRNILIESSTGDFLSLGAGTKTVLCEQTLACSIGGPAISFANGDTTPSVKNAHLCLASSNTGVTVALLDDGIEGQEIVLVFGNSNYTMFNGSELKLTGGFNWNPQANDTLTLIKAKAAGNPNFLIWFEKCRSVNH